MAGVGIAGCKRCDVVCGGLSLYAYGNLSGARGFDISHCYLIEMGKLTDKSPDYIPNQTDEQEDADILELVDRLRRRPEIEAVSLSQNSYPYNGSNSTDLVQYDTLISGNWTIRRLVTPDFVRVFRYQGTRGETPEQLAGMLEKGEFLASDNLYRKYGRPLTEFVGKSFRLFGDTIQPTGWERPWRMYVTMISSRPAIRIPFFINSIGMIRDWNSVSVSAKIRTMISSNA